MPRRPNFSDLRKRVKERVAAWILMVLFLYYFSRRKFIELTLYVLSGFVILLLLIDEAIKEGYVFDCRDVFIIGTHEFLVVAIIVITTTYTIYTRFTSGIVTYIYHRVRGKSNATKKGVEEKQRMD